MSKRKYAECDGLDTSVLRSKCCISKDNCLFCGRGDTQNGRDKKTALIPVRTIEFKETLLEVCKKRCTIPNCVQE